MSTTENSRIIERPGTSEVIPITFEEDPFYTDLTVKLASSSFYELYEQYTPNSSGSHTEWKDFSHFKSVSNSSNGMAVRFANGAWCNGFNHYAFGTTRDPYCFYSYEFGVGGRLDSGLPSYWDGTSTGNQIVPPTKLNEWLGAAFTAMLPYIRPKVSLVNSIYELKDFKSVPRTLTNVKNIYTTLLGTWKGPLGQCVKKSLRQLLRGSSDVYLQKKFNIDPLISDIKGVYTSLSRTEKRLNALMSREGRTQRAHFSRAFVEYEDRHDVVPEFSLGPDYPNGWFVEPRRICGTATSERFVSNSPSEFHVELEYSYNYAQYQVEHARLLGLLDDLGVNFNPAIIWNAIPWSFVVDWVVGVSRWLNDNRIGFMDPALCIRRGCWSIRRSRHILVQRQLKMTKDEGGTQMGVQTAPLPAVDQTAYRRKIFKLTDIISSLSTSGLSPTELSLASALVLSRRSRHRRRSK